jgi:SAM-dependent methyltransferase
MEPASVRPWDAVYEARTAPWLIGQPQPAIVELARSGWIRGEVLDVGCGAGEHTIELTRLGHSVLGVDLSGRAVEYARANAAAQRVDARFEVADALALDGGPRFDTILDSALFHIFGSAEDRAAYVSSLHGVCRPGGRVHVLALALTDEPAFGPRISDAVIREAFGTGWTLEDLRPTRYRVRVGESDAAHSGLPAGELADIPAWLARARRD